jgi:hypothetical protein
VNIAIAVGLITAGSTLAGGIIASIATLKAQSSQIKQQQGAQRRAIRREAYVQLLNKFDEVDSLFQECWEMRLNSEPDRPVDLAFLAPLDRGVKSFDNAMNAVKLEGPEDVVVAAAQVQNAFREEGLFLAHLAIDSSKSGAAIRQIAEMKYQEFYDSRQAVKSHLIKVAASTLGKTLPGEVT